MTSSPTSNPAPASAQAASVYISSILAVTAVFFVAVGIPSGFAFGWPAGMGLGAMCAVWGGPGFGVMAAGARLELAAEHALVDDQAVVVESTRYRRSATTTPRFGASAPSTLPFG